MQMNWLFLVMLMDRGYVMNHTAFFCDVNEKSISVMTIGDVNSLTPKSVPAGTKLVLFGRYVHNIYVGIVRYFLRKTKTQRAKNLLTDTTHKSANIVRY